MSSKIRNIVILGHLQSGKTTLVESLYSITSGAPKGSIENGTTISDYTAEEKAKMSSIKSSIVPINYKDYKINLIDVPGSDDFISEAISAVGVVKGAVVVIDAQAGVEVQTIKHWNMLRKKNIPTFIYVNKMDKEEVHFDQLMDSIREKLGKNAIPFCYPMGHKDEFDGFVNCVTLKARKFNGKECEDAEIYDEKKAKVFELHNTMVEAVAQTSEELLEKFFNGEALDREEIQAGLRTGVLSSELTPVLVGSATKNIGLHTMLDMFIDYLPNPSDLKPVEGQDEKGNKIERKTLDDEPFSAFVFKTIVDPYAGVSSIFKINSGVLKAGQNIYIPNLGKSVAISQLFTLLGGKTSSVQQLNAGDIGCITKIDGLETSMTLCDPKNIIVYPKLDLPTPVYYKGLVPKTKQDEDKLSMVLAKIMLEDQTIEIKRNVETSQQLIGTLSLGHLNYILEKMKNSYKLDLNTEDVKIVYR